MPIARRLAAVVVGAWVLSLVAFVPTPASSRTVDARCVGRAPIPASLLTRDAAVPGCSLVGRVVVTRHFRFVVPPPGTSVSGEGLSRHGDVAGLTVTNTGTRVVAAPETRATAPAGKSLRACGDRAFDLEHAHWATPLRWRDHVSKAPARLDTSTVVKQITQANANMRTGRNTCGKSRLTTPSAQYLGRTRLEPDITTSRRQVTCGRYDKRNVVGFGNLPGALLGWTCFWWVGRGRMVAADVMMDDGPGLVTRVPSRCVNRWDFEGAVTHEFGHVYGLAHTGSGHANLTMAHALQPCSPYARTLGLGDWLGMDKMYGAR